MARNEDGGGVVKRQFYVQAPDGYICIETASCEYEAILQASRRPGYETGVRCREQLEIERQRGYMPELWENRRR